MDVVCAVIVGRDGRILACQRDDARHLGGLWEFPGGKVEDGETAERALIREIKEEIGVEIQLTGTYSPVSWDYEARSIKLHPYRCVIVAGEPKALEHQDMCWCRLDELTALKWAGADLPIVEEILRNAASD